MAVTQASRELGPSFQGIDESLLDYAVRIGTTARREDLEKTRKTEKTQKTQMELLMTSLESVPDRRLVLLVTAIFAKRQAQRGHLGRETARLVSEAMKHLYERNMDASAARVLLGLAKWVYEASEGLQMGRTVGSAREFVGILAGTRG